MSEWGQLSLRARGVLQSLGLNEQTLTMVAVSELKQSDLRREPNCGRKTLNELTYWLESGGLKFVDDGEQARAEWSEAQRLRREEQIAGFETIELSDENNKELDRRVSEYRESITNALKKRLSKERYILAKKIARSHGI